MIDMAPLFTITGSKYALLIFLICFPGHLLLAQKFMVRYQYSHKDTAAPALTANLKKTFASPADASIYIESLPREFIKNGFPVASVDSVAFDSTSAKVFIFAGKKYFWSIIDADSVDAAIALKTGLKPVMRGVSIQNLQKMREKILSQYKNTGYPFAIISMEDIQFNGDSISGKLRIEKGKYYQIDSIRIYGGAKIGNVYLQKYLGIENGSPYNEYKLQQISRLIKELPFIQESGVWSVTMHGTGATLNLYLEPKRSSSADVLIGFLPSDEITGKAKISADMNLNLKNVFASAENLILNWQQLQPRSPRLHLAYSQPYFLKSNFGIDLSFQLFKQDSAYLDLQSLLGVNYVFSQTGDVSVFYKNENRYLLEGAISPDQIIYSKKLPQNIDVRSQNAGVAFHSNSTDYRLNPRRGREFFVEGVAGIKKYEKNNEILDLEDPAKPDFNFATLYDSIKLKSYRMQITARVAQYVPAGKNTVLKVAVNGGLLESPQLFFNELFRLGGYRVIRGFDEESIFASSYGVLTTEYRYLTGVNSYFFIFSDAALTGTNTYESIYSNTFLSGGAGLELETKFGLLNISYAIGNRNDVKFDLRNSSRIHFGYINYF